MSSSEYVAFDFDGTLVRYDRVYKPTEFGEPIQQMVELVKAYLKDGMEVRIFTARASYSGTDKKDVEAQIKFSADHGETLTPEEALARIKYWNYGTADSIAAIKAWCVEQFGQELEVTCTKDFRMALLYDDRARHVVFNEGTVCCGH